jgi:hypothetical protein
MHAGMRRGQDALPCSASTSSAAAMIVNIYIENIFLSYVDHGEDDVTDTPLAAGTLVRDCPAKQAAVSWPLPVDVRLEELLAQAEAAGENTSRRELVAAIICFTRVTDVQLGRLLRRYRTAMVRDVIYLPEGKNVVPFTKHKPGPRTSSARQPR